MATVRTFHRYRGETSFTIARLAEILREQIPLIVPSQSRYRVTEIPTARTIRFYTASGLVDKPGSGKDGRSGYGYRQLLQILAVKYLQSQYLPLVKVRSLVENADNRELESMIPAVAPVTAAHRGIARQDRTLPGRPFPAETSWQISAHPSPPPPASARVPAPDSAAAGAPAATAVNGPGPDLWHRVEVSPGIELHVLDAALSGEHRERLRGALLRELGALRGWFGAGEKS